MSKLYSLRLWYLFIQIHGSAKHAKRVTHEQWFQQICFILPTLLNVRWQEGVHQERESDEPEVSAEQLKLMCTQDQRYVNMKYSSELKVQNRSNIGHFKLPLFVSIVMTLYFNWHWDTFAISTIISLVTCVRSLPFKSLPEPLNMCLIFQ